ncbi:MAG: N-acetylmuramoyl-L-alanine amidase [Marinilabiliales bacterium]|nr:MAG: N-acetylmuramoyl-L-alanine amidase [Marinilabiliales bacterium]
MSRNFIRYISIILTILISTPAFSQSTEATAKKGEGIYSLLRRHNLDPSTDFNDFVTLNKDRLGRNNALIAGRKYLLPDGSASSSSGAYPIFGAEYSDVKITDRKLSGAVFYLVSGHGGPDPGAVGKINGRTVSEDEYAYDITLRLARKLVEHGALVYMIIRDNNDGIRNDKYLPLDKDEVCYPNLTIPLDKNARLRQRARAVNNLYRKNRSKKHHRCVVIHVDSRTKGQNIDVFFYHHQYSKSGKRLAQRLQSTFKQKYAQHQPGRVYSGTVSHRNLYMIRKTDPPAVFIELGNINNSKDQRRFLPSDNREALAKWLYEGLYEDFRKPQ